MADHGHHDGEGPALQVSKDTASDSRTQDSRTSILETTFGLLGTTAYDKLSMQRIAGSARVSKALLFYFFGSKKELVREALIWGSKREMESMHSFVDGDPDGSKVTLTMPISEIISYWMKNSIERIQILHTYFEVTDTSDRNDVVNIELRALFQHIIGALEVPLRENGLNYPREQAILLSLLIDTIGYLPIITPDEFDPARILEALLDLFQFSPNANDHSGNEGAIPTGENDTK